MQGGHRGLRCKVKHAPSLAKTRDLPLFLSKVKASVSYYYSRVLCEGEDVLGFTMTLYFFRFCMLYYLKMCNFAALWRIRRTTRGSSGQIDFFLQKVCEFPVLLSKCGAKTIPEFQLHTKDRQKDIVRDVMRELGAGPRQMVRVCGLTYAVVYKMWKDL